MIVGSVLAALQARFTALFDSTVVVYVGLPVTSNLQDELVLLAHDGEEDSEVGAETTYEWANIAGTSRYEITNIPCAVISQSGSVDMLARFQRMEVVLKAMENALVADMNTGGALSGLVMGITITAGVPRPLQNQAGSRVLAPFTVSYRAQV